MHAKVLHRLAVVVLVGLGIAALTAPRRSLAAIDLPTGAKLETVDFERHVIMERLERCNWSQTETAESFHVPLSTLNQKIKRLDIKIRKKGES